MRRLFAIRHAVTLCWLPANPRGYGHTQMMPEANATPRLFDTKQKAENSLRMWRCGATRLEYEREYDDTLGRSFDVPDGWTCDQQSRAERKGMPMEVVEVRIAVIGGRRKQAES